MSASPSPVRSGGDPKVTKAVLMFPSLAARATAEAWQFAGDEALLEEVRRLRGVVDQLGRLLEANSSERGGVDARRPND